MEVEQGLLRLPRVAGGKRRDAPVQVIYNIDVVMRCPDEFREV